MIYRIEDGRITKAPPQEMEDAGNIVWGLFTFTQIEDAQNRFGLPGDFLAEAIGNRATRYESHDGFDFMCLNVMMKDEPEFLGQVCAYIAPNRLLFFLSDTTPIARIVERIAGDTTKSTGFGRLLYAFFESVTTGDAEDLEEIEQEISELEDVLITTRKKDCVADIIGLRKKLMIYKRYYEQLLNVLDELQENENNLINRKALRYIKIYEGRVDRLYHSVLNLRDYVTQVREAYQAEVDISLNNIMKLFTVITAIFLPLTLIVGWYGMNLQMPEFGWKYGYPMVIGVSLSVLVICLAFFRKNRWFK